MTGDGKVLNAAAGAGFGALLSGTLVFMEIFFMEYLPARTPRVRRYRLQFGTAPLGDVYFLNVFSGPTPDHPVGHFRNASDVSVSRTHVGRSLWQG